MQRHSLNTRLSFEASAEGLFLASRTYPRNLLWWATFGPITIFVRVCAFCPLIAIMLLWWSLGEAKDQCSYSVWDASSR